MSTRNGLHRLSALGAVLVGAFLLLGAFGHVNAVLPSLTGGTGEVDAFALLLPGVILAAAGLVDVAFCKVLWAGTKWALDAALAVNAATLGYLGLLLWKGVPDHPLAMFTAIVACFTVLLAATRMGLVWPAGGLDAGDGRPG